MRLGNIQIMLLKLLLNANKSRNITQDVILNLLLPQAFIVLTNTKKQIYRHISINLQKQWLYRIGHIFITC